MTNYPKDRFDDLPVDLDRRGAHRAPRTRASKIASWLWGLGAICVLVALGFIGMNIVDGIVNGPGQASSTPTATATEQAAEETPTPTPSHDANLVVTVNNGTGGSGVATAATTKLTAKGWNAQVGDGDSTGHTTTVIAYGDPADEGAAMQIALDLGGGEPTLAPGQAPKGTIVVTVGEDVAGR